MKPLLASALALALAGCVAPSAPSPAPPLPEPPAPVRMECFAQQTGPWGTIAAYWETDGSDALPVFQMDFSGSGNARFNLVWQTQGRIAAPEPTARTIVSLEVKQPQAGSWLQLWRDDDRHRAGSAELAALASLGIGALTVELRWDQFRALADGGKDIIVAEVRKGRVASQARIDPAMVGMVEPMIEALRAEVTDIAANVRRRCTPSGDILA